MENTPLFPITPHLRGSCGTQDDTFMDLPTTERILHSTLLAQEKLDGFNIGICVNSAGNFVVIQKNRVITWNQYEWLTGLENWCAKEAQVLLHELGDRIALFGEFLPGLAGYELPWFVFDCYDRMAHRFLSLNELHHRTRRIQLNYVPLLFEGVPRNINIIEQLIGTSSVTNTRMEGVYLRLEDPHYLRERYKYVRNDYQKSITV